MKSRSTANIHLLGLHAASQMGSLNISKQMTATKEEEKEVPLVTNLISPIFNQGLIGFGAATTSSHELDDSNSSIDQF